MSDPVSPPTPNLVEQVAPGFVDAHDSALHATAPDRIRARTRMKAIFVVWLWELACGLFVATPVHAWALRAWGSHPDGDAMFFRPGGNALLTWLANGESALSIDARMSIVSLAVFAVFGQFITGALVAALAMSRGNADRPPPLRFMLGAGASSFIPLLVTWLVFGAIQGFILGIGVFASSAIDDALKGSLGDARSFSAHLAVLAIFGVALAGVGVVSDVVRVAIAREVSIHTAPAESRLGARQRGVAFAALRVGFGAIGRLAGAWGWRAALSLVLLYAASRVGDIVGQRGGGALWILFVVHQTIALARVGLRASWLAYALRLVAARTGATTSSAATSAT